MAEKKTMKVRAGRVEQRIDEDTFAPLADIYQREDETSVVTVDIPGAEAQTVDVRVDRGVLTISAEAELPEIDGDYSCTYTGFVGGKFYRAFALGDEVDRDRIEASLSDGVLTIVLPRAAAARTRKIEIKEA